MNKLFLELTHLKTDNVLKDNMYGDTVFLDPTKIVTINQQINEKKEIYTTVFLQGPVVLDVKETPQEIADKIIKQLMPDEVNYGGPESQNNVKKLSKE